MKKLLLIVVVASVFVAIYLPKQPSTASSPKASASAASVAPAAPKPAALTKEAREELIARATKGFDLSRDKMEAISFFRPHRKLSYGPSFESYLSVPDGRPALLRIIAMYSGSDWIFFTRIKVMADDVIVYEKEFNSRDIIRDNSAGTVWESVDYFADVQDRAAIERISEAKSVTVRFSGRERRSDHNLSKGELERLKLVIKAHKDLAPLEA